MSRLTEPSGWSDAARPAVAPAPDNDNCIIGLVSRWCTGIVDAEPGDRGVLRLAHGIKTLSQHPPDLGIRHRVLGGRTQHRDCVAIAARAYECNRQIFPARQPGRREGNRFLPVGNGFVILMLARVPELQIHMGG